LEVPLGSRFLSRVETSLGDPRSPKPAEQLWVGGEPHCVALFIHPGPTCEHQRRPAGVGWNRMFSRSPGSRKRSWASPASLMGTVFDGQGMPHHNPCSSISTTKGEPLSSSAVPGGREPASQFGAIMLGSFLPGQSSNLRRCVIGRHASFSNRLPPSETRLAGAET
jgi:hypothetical protein